MNKAQFQTLFVAQMKNLQKKVAKHLKRMMGRQRTDADSLISDVWQLLFVHEKWTGFQAGDDPKSDGKRLVLWVMGFIRNLAWRHAKGMPWDCANPRSRNRMGNRIRVHHYEFINPETGSSYESSQIAEDPLVLQAQSEEWELRKKTLLKVVAQHPEKAELIRRYHEENTNQLQNELGISGNALRIRIFRDKKELRELGKAYLAALAS